VVLADAPVTETARDKATSDAAPSAYALRERVAKPEAPAAPIVGSNVAPTQPMLADAELDALVTEARQFQDAAGAAAPAASAPTPAASPAPLAKAKAAVVTTPDDIGPLVAQLAWAASPVAPLTSPPAQALAGERNQDRADAERKRAAPHLAVTLANRTIGAIAVPAGSLRLRVLDALGRTVTTRTLRGNETLIVPSAGVLAWEEALNGNEIAAAALMIETVDGLRSAPLLTPQAASTMPPAAAAPPAAEMMR
jgi:hypothetical protein